MSSARPAKYFLVFDPFSGHIWPEETSPFFASSLLAQAMIGQYDGFYLSTLALPSGDYETFLRISPSLSHYQDKDAAKYLLLERLKEDFSKLTGLACQAVCIPEDGRPEYGCGKAFQHLLQTHEAQAQAEDKRTESTTPQITHRRKFSFLSNNPQLSLIAKHASHQFPDTDIVLDYLECSSVLCSLASIDHNPDFFPANVYLNVYRYDELRNNQPRQQNHPQRLNLGRDYSATSQGGQSELSTSQEQKMINVPEDPIVNTNHPMPSCLTKTLRLFRSPQINPAPTTTNISTTHEAKIEQENTDQKSETSYCRCM